jgi:hypothetical protein
VLSNEAPAADLDELCSTAHRDPFPGSGLQPIRTCDEYQA